MPGIEMSRIAAPQDSPKPATKLTVRCQPGLSRVRRKYRADAPNFIADNKHEIETTSDIGRRRPDIIEHDGLRRSAAILREPLESLNLK